MSRYRGKTTQTRQYVVWKKSQRKRAKKNKGVRKNPMRQGGMKGKNGDSEQASGGKYGTMNLTWKKGLKRGGPTGAQIIKQRVGIDGRNTVSLKNWWKFTQRGKSDIKRNSSLNRQGGTKGNLNNTDTSRGSIIAANQYKHKKHLVLPPDLTETEKTQPHHTIETKETERDDLKNDAQVTTEKRLGEESYVNDWHKQIPVGDSTQAKSGGSANTVKGKGGGGRRKGEGGKMEKSTSTTTSKRMWMERARANSILVWES